MKFIRDYEIESWVETQPEDDERDRIFYAPDCHDIFDEPEQLSG